jgi:hypothetical protein
MGETVSIAQVVSKMSNIRYVLILQMESYNSPEDNIVLQSDEEVLMNNVYEIHVSVYTIGSHLFTSESSHETHFIV